MRDDRGQVSGIFCEGYDVTDQGQAERALQDSQERLQLALDAADMGTFVWFPQEDRTEADAQMMALFSLPDDGLLNLATALADSILPEDGARYAEAVARACDPEGPGQLRQDIRVRRPDGSVRWLGITAQVFVEGDPPRATRMAGAAVDITDRKLIEAALRESETRLRFLDVLGRAVGASVDADGILATTTRMVAEHLGVSICAYADMDEDQDGFTIRGDWSAPGSPSVVGHYSLADFGRLAVERLGAGQPLIINDNLAELAPEEAATFQAIGIGSTICMPLIREGRLTALMAIHDRGPRVWTSTELATLTEVTERSWAHIARVRAETELRQSAQALRELNEELETRVAEALAERKVLADLVESAEAFVLVCDLGFNLLAMNHAAVAEFERAFGVSIAVGDNLVGCLAHLPEQQAEVRAAWGRALAGEAYTEVLQFGDPSRRRQFYEVRFDILRDASGKQIGAYQFVYDVTDRLRDQARLAEAQAALHQSQKMETVGQLTGGVAHDFNNLLMPIVGALDMLRGRLAGDERAQRLTNAALQAADRAQTLVQRLLAFSRRQHLSPRAVDVRSLIESMADLVSRSLGPRIRLVLEIVPDLPPAHVDPNQLELALLNLAVNARDAMGGEGTLTVRAQPAAEGEILGGSGAFVQISVADTGVGMDAETLKRAIEPFFTTKGVGRGTGLGLSSVQGLAEQSGGTFRLTSTRGRGTTATLYLPVSSETPAAPLFSRAAPAEDGPRPARHAVILLVDDEDLVRAGAADMLTEAGYTVEEASSGYRAVQLLRGGLRPDAVVTDYAMPGMSGAELAREVRKAAPGVPVLMITGYATLTDREAGDLPRLSKPFRQADLVSAVEGIMETASVQG
jgi:signal transduction histidine kinase